MMRIFRHPAPLLVLLLLAGCAGSLAPGAGARATRAEWLERAQQGDPQAQFVVGRSYCCGRGIAYNTERAVAWYCRAAVQGHAEAQFELAKIYANRLKLTTRLLSAGKSFTDRERAYIWYTAAMVAGQAGAEEHRAQLMEGLEPADLSRARRAATRWRTTVCPPIETPRRAG
ncbi:MAG: sel1 repeat family protein [Gammaproteobacteria bacterium]|jgi:TPR repeat protein|nr:sel1 repeat family protein [Gammaproteobacteria bacterium]